MNELMVENGAHRIDRYALRDIETPEPTCSWKPVGHGMIADLVCQESTRRNFITVSEEFAVNNSQGQMYGVLRFHPMGHPEYSRALACQNSIDKSISVRLACGISVLCCSNLCIGGECVIKRKHTIGIEVRSLIENAFDHMESSFRKLEDDIENMKTIRVTQNKARILAVRAAQEKVISSSLILSTLKEYDEPSFDEFKPRTMWSFVNALTHVIKGYSPQRQAQGNRALSRMFDLG